MLILFQRKALAKKIKPKTVQLKFLSLKKITKIRIKVVKEKGGRNIIDQMKNGKTTLIEAMINQELGEPFRRDAMKKPVAVAGICINDMKPQAV